MTTEGPLDTCCNHGETIAGKLDRVIEVLEEIRDARLAHGGTTEKSDDGQPVIADGCVIQGSQRPDNGIQVHIDPHHVIGATIHELRRQGRLR